MCRLVWKPSIDPLIMWLYESVVIDECWLVLLFDCNYHVKLPFRVDHVQNVVLDMPDHSASGC